MPVLSDAHLKGRKSVVKIKIMRAQNDEMYGSITTNVLVVITKYEICTTIEVHIKPF